MIILHCPECGKDKEYESEHERGQMCLECLSNEAQYQTEIYLSPQQEGDDGNKKIANIGS